MAIWLARYHGGISFSLAVSLTFLALIVHQRATHKTSRPTEANASLAEQVEPAAEPSHVPNVYAEKWRAMANEYYAKHPLPEIRHRSRLPAIGPHHHRTTSPHLRQRHLHPSSSLRISNPQVDRTMQADLSPINR